MKYPILKGDACSGIHWILFICSDIQWISFIGKKKERGTEVMQRQTSRWVTVIRWHQGGWGWQVSFEDPSHDFHATVFSCLMERRLVPEGVAGRLSEILCVVLLLLYHLTCLFTQYFKVSPVYRHFWKVSRNGRNAISPVYRHFMLFFLFLDTFSLISRPKSVQEWEKTFSPISRHFLSFLQSLVGSSGGYTSHGYTSHASPRACGARLGRIVQERPCARLTL